MVGTNSKTVTLRLDRTTTFHCTITNGTDPCFDLGPGSAVIGDGRVVTLPNATITFASNANVVAGQWHFYFLYRLHDHKPLRGRRHRRVCETVKRHLGL